MDEIITKEMALQNLFNAARMANLRAEQHEYNLKCVQVLMKELGIVVAPPQETEKLSTKKKINEKEK